MILTKMILANNHQSDIIYIQGVGLWLRDSSNQRPSNGLLRQSFCSSGEDDDDDDGNREEVEEEEDDSDDESGDDDIGNDDDDTSFTASLPSWLNHMVMMVVMTMMMLMTTVMQLVKMMTLFLQPLYPPGRIIHIVRHHPKER